MTHRLSMFRFSQSTVQKHPFVKDHRAPGWPLKEGSSADRWGDWRQKTPREKKREIKTKCGYINSFPFKHSCAAVSHHRWCTALSSAPYFLDLAHMTSTHSSARRTAEVSSADVWCEKYFRQFADLLLHRRTQEVRGGGCWDRTSILILCRRKGPVLFGTVCFICLGLYFHPISSTQPSSFLLSS